MKKYLIFTAIILGALVMSANAQIPYFFSNDLTIGSSGQDVVNLQSWLINNGFDIPAISSGRIVKGYFGSQTREALANYQKSISLPAYGFFGPMTRGRLNDGDRPGASLLITSPNGGEIWQKGTIQNITWAGASSGLLNRPGDIRLEFPLPACANPNQPVQCMIAVRAPLTIATNVNLNSGSYSWYVGNQISYSCIPEDQSSCTIPDGQYKIHICPTNVSSSLQCDDSDNYFTITSGTTNNQAPVINGVDAPTSLTINQTGTWTVRATDPSNGTLSYYVDWGDVFNCNWPRTCANASAGSPQYTQNTSFTHSYSNAGQYQVSVMVRNQAGLSAQTSSTVTVTNSNNQAGPLKITSPNGGEVWQKGTTQRITWSSPYYFAAAYVDLKITQKYNCTSQICPMIAYAPFTIATNIPINQNSYSWNVGDAISNVTPCLGLYSGSCPQTSSAIVPNGQYTIQICETGTSNCDSSNGTFTITSNQTSNLPDINIVSPNGGETWQAGSIQNVTVNVSGQAGQIGDAVSVFFTDSSGVSNGNGFGLGGFPTGGTPGIKTFPITLPSGWVGTHKLYVTLSKSNPANCYNSGTTTMACSVPPTIQAYDYSDNYFTIIAPMQNSCNSQGVCI